MKQVQTGLSLTLRPFDRLFFERSGVWLQDTELLAMIDSQPISELDRVTWFQKLPTRNDYKVWGVAMAGEPVAVVGFRNIQNDCAEYFGYIGEQRHRGKGIGKWMLLRALQELAHLGGVTMVELRVLFSNVVAINLYLNAGFKIARVDGDRCYIMTKNISRIAES